MRIKQEDEAQTQTHTEDEAQTDEAQTDEAQTQTQTHTIKLV